MSLEEVYSALDMWEQTQVCVRGHVASVRTEIEELCRLVDRAAELLANSGHPRREEWHDRHEQWLADARSMGMHRR